MLFCACYPAFILLVVFCFSYVLVLFFFFSCFLWTSSSFVLPFLFSTLVHLILFLCSCYYALVILLMFFFSLFFFLLLFFFYLDFFISHRCLLTVLSYLLALQTNPGAQGIDLKHGWIKPFIFCLIWLELSLFCCWP